MTLAATDLGFLAGGSFSQALNCSDNGDIVVGQATDATNTFSVYWDAANVIHQLPLLPGFLGLPDDQASACSSDGSTIVGIEYGPTDVPFTSFSHAVTWTGGSYTVTDLGGFPGGTPELRGAVAHGCAGDASVIVGGAYANDGDTLFTPCVWLSGTIHALPVPGGYLGGIAYACSADGTTIVGIVYTDPTQENNPIVWTLTGPLTWAATILGTIGGSVPGVNSLASACSSDGSIIAGNASDSGGLANAAYWVSAAVHQLPGPLGGQSSTAKGCDGSGVYVCGADINGIATLWISDVGQSLPLFPGALSVDMAFAVSRDATVVVGLGTDGGSSQVAVKWTGIPAPPPPRVVNRGFLICGNNWTITAPLLRVYGLDHLIGRQVVGLADGVPVGPLTVQADGSVVLPFVASYITLGLSFIVQLQTPYLDTGNPTVQGRRKDITAVTVRVDASAAPMVGSNQPDGGSFTPTEIGPVWTNLQPTVTQDPEQFPRTYTTPVGATVNQLFSGDFRGNLQPGWDERGQIAVEQTLPLPLSITAVMPEVLVGDSPEQAIQSKQGGQGDDGQHGPGLWMITSRGRR